MTHQNHQTNGASLEDCHTNFFALTELFGIKWRKLVWGETSVVEGEDGAPLADPVISSYARCLAGDILCVWRRVPAPQPPPDIYDMAPAPPPQPPPLSLRAAKELWIFWYGEEPDLNGLVAPELISGQSEHGSWESGLSYECRSLLFKALHNLIERCLLSRDFVRLGKWFVQPYDGDEEDVGKSPWHLSFSFAFFLHGESTVCASVDVRQHPPVRTLTAKRLAKLNSPDNQPDAKVILAPFGLEGTLTGRQWSDSDAATARLLDAWRQLYPLEQGCGAVEVVCGGARMRYPVPYALMTEVERPPPDVPRPAAAPRAHRALTAPAPHQTLEICYADPSGDKNDDFMDPTRKTPCTCTKWRRRRTPRPPPFHRRTRTHTLAHQSACGSGSPGSCSGSPPAAPPSASPHHTVLPTHQTSGLVPTTLHTPAPTPDPLAPPTPAPSCLPPSKLYNQSDSPSCPELQRRPVLPVAERRLDPLEDEHSLHMLYDYTTVYAWLEHPVKRFKSEEGRFREELALGTAQTSDLYAGHQHITPDLLPNIKQERQNTEDIKDYKNLFTSDGLCPTYKDLDQIFDNSDDAASGDETVRLMSTSLDKCEEERARCAGRCVRAEELSKMFPTPPSMEAHAQPSPGFSLPDDPPPAIDPPPDCAIEDWSFVFKPPTMYKYVGSCKYAPLTTLPSQLLPPVSLPPHAVYRPRPRPEPEPDAAPHDPDTAAATTPAAAAPATPADTHRTGVKRSASPATESRLSTSCRGRVAPPPSRAAPPPTALPACPLLVNVLLADTVLNVFRDHNFDSCTLCVCNEGSKGIGNIRGADAVTYLSDAADGSGEEPTNCTCGFSAIVNRRLAHRSGLFYEDEMEITGCAEVTGGAGGVTGGAGGARGCRVGEVAGAVLAQLGAVHAAPVALTRAADHAAHNAHPHEHLRLNLLEYSDGGAAAAKALRAAGGANSNSNSTVNGVINENAPSAVHRWPFIGARAPRSSRDVVRLMRRLRPLLQDAIQKRCCGARMWDGVTGPLTWRQFHRLAGRRNEDLCEPQPVPPLLVGHDRDWISLSPYALRHWERLGLEPYAYSRDVAYVVIAADCDALADPLRAFFRELSTAYEACRLGRHRPVTRLARDGLVRTGPARSGDADEWAGPLPEGRLGRYLRAYGEALRTALVPQLATLTLDRTLLEGERSDVMRPPATPERPSSPTEHEAEPAPAPPPPAAPDDDEAGPPALVLYIVEPPAAAAHRASALHALLRLAANIYNHLHHHNPLVKIISLESVSEQWSGEGVGGEARALAFSVYSSARRLLQHHANGKSLTGFGTAAAANLFLQAKDEKNRAPYRLFSPAWVLAAPRALREVAETWGQGGTTDAVLFVSYCLSHDQRWLLAAATDARGELLDTIAINIHVPHRSRRRRSGTARRLGLTKLMDFTLGVMSQAAQPWRLVIGRVGRIGHGELKGWSWLLSRKNLDQVSTTLKDLCGSCGSGAPCVLSACLVSTEPDSCLRLMADRFTPDERFSQASIQSHLHTPRDVTATHILVFPTSATTQSTPMTFEQPLANGEDSDMMLLDMNDEDGEHIDDLLINCDMFNNMWAQGSPRRADDDAASPPPHLAQQRLRDEAGEERVGTVLQQPLALGYTVSTAPLAGMPAWWWAGCAHLRDACPAFLKTALHLHSVHGADDYAAFTTRRDQPAHPLDSQTTTDVLRYVLEGYNALSWLALDAHTHDRLSCLPLHVQVLMQLYHATSALA